MTGVLKSMKRSAAEALIREHGGIIARSVSAKLDFLICGESPGSKLQKAKDYKINILFENEWRKMLDI